MNVPGALRHVIRTATTLWAVTLAVVMLVMSLTVTDVLVMVWSLAMFHNESSISVFC